MMKRFSWWPLLIVLAILLQGCGGGVSTNGQSDDLSGESTVDDVSNTSATQPDPVQSDPVQPDPVEPDPVEPDPVEPDPVEPDPVQPDPVQPDPVQPDPVQPDPVQPDPATANCAYESTSASVNSNTSISFSVQNLSARALQMYWLDLQGNRQPYAVVNPGATVAQQTFSGHAWLLLDNETRACVALYQSVSNGQTISVSTNGSFTPNIAESFNPIVQPAVNRRAAEPLPSAVRQKVVRFVYFVESGQSFKESEYLAIRTQAFAMQQYWYEQFGGTFLLYDDIVATVYGDRQNTWYLSTPDNVHSIERWYRLGNMKNEVYRKLNINDFDQQVRVINYPTSRFDGRVGGNFGGAWMDGDDLTCMLGANSGYNFPYDEQGPAHCLGHVVHEFGHVYQLGHTGPNEDCMQFGFYIYTIQGNMCNFGAGNRYEVINHRNNAGWLDALPGQVVTPQGTIVTR